MPAMLTYPSVQRLIKRPYAYGGSLAVGERRAVGGGTLTQRSGLPVLVPLSVPADPSALRRP